MKFVFNDGGRAEAGYKAGAGDCVVRSIVIATGLPYQKVYDDLNELCKPHNDKRKKKGKKGLSSSRDGVARPIYEKYLLALGWKWQPTMFIGQGCKVHLKEDELPKGRLIVNVSKHMLCVIDGVIHDTYIETRDGTRCVYGYFYLPEKKMEIELTADTIKKVAALKEIRDSYNYHTRLILRLERDARIILKDDLSPNIFTEVISTLANLEEKAEELESRMKEEAKQRESAAKAKTLESAKKKCTSFGFKIIDRPKVRFGTTEDHTYRIVGIAKVGKIQVALIWSGGGTWSDNGGQHYGESRLELREVTLKDGVLTARTFFGGVNLPTLLSGGRLTVKRLEEVQDKIKKIIPNFKPAIVPWDYTILY